MTQAEKLIKIIINDLLKYLRLKERGLVAENRLKRQIPLERRENKDTMVQDPRPREAGRPR